MISTIQDGEMIDIHGGGMDLKFPHHENEIAQANGCYNHNIANYWIHNGFINIDDEKMSKSLGNVKWAKDVIAAIGSNVFRLATMSTQYRAPLNFSDELIESTRKELEKIENALKQANLILTLNDDVTKELDEAIMKEYMDYMEDDLNTPNAITVVLDTVKKINHEARNKNLDVVAFAKMKNSLEKMLEILGVFIELHKITDEDIKLYNKWQEAKDNKDFASADKYREQLVELGIL